MSLNGWNFGPRFFVSKLRFAFWPALELVSFPGLNVFSLSLQFMMFTFEVFGVKEGAIENV